MLQYIASSGSYTFHLRVFNLGIYLFIYIYFFRDFLNVFFLYIFLSTQNKLIPICLLISPTYSVLSDRRPSCVLAVAGQQTYSVRPRGQGHGCGPEHRNCEGRFKVGQAFRRNQDNQHPHKVVRS